MRDLKIPMIVLAFAVVLTLGLGARALYYQERVVGPLAGLAGAVDGVEAIEVVDTASGLKEVRALLSADVRLEEAYGSLEELARTNLGSAFGGLVIEDRRSAELEEAYYHVHFAVQEGISTGHFNRMAEVIEGRLAEMGISGHRVYVADEYVFVQLHDGGAYLYEAVPRPQLVAARIDSVRGAFGRW